jgi:hypothetical protein
MNRIARIIDRPEATMFRRLHVARNVSRPPSRSAAEPWPEHI